MDIISPKLHTPKTIQEFFDHTDWAQLRAHKLSLMAAINYCELLGRAKARADLRALQDWIDCLQVVAEAEGYPVFQSKVKV